MLRLKLVWWAILARPIIYGVRFLGGLEIASKNRNVLVAKNQFGKATIGKIDGTR